MWNETVIGQNVKVVGRIESCSYGVKIYSSLAIFVHDCT